MGSPEFALPTLEQLAESEHDLVAVVTQPDRPAGRKRTLRPPSVKDFALAHGLTILQPERVNARSALDALRELAPDAIVIAAYGQILKQPFLEIPRRGVLNVHASLLPKHRGASPIAAAIIAGEQETGVTIIEVVLALDAGPALAAQPIAIDKSDTAGTLSEKLARLGADLLVKTLSAWERNEIAAAPQDDAEATFAPLVRAEDGVIDWSLPAVDVWRRVRAYNPWPIATTLVGDEPLRVLEAWPIELRGGGAPGTVFALPEGSGAPAGAGFAVSCGTDAVAVVRAQRAGKRPLTGEELLRGWRGLVGRRLGA